MTAPLTPPVDLVTTAVLTLLRGTAEKDKPQWVYDAAYSGSPTAPPYWYAILYSLFGGSRDPLPDLDAGYDEASLAFQVSTVSNLRNQAQAGARVLETRFLTGPLVMPAGWVCIDRRPDPSNPGVDRSGDPPNAIYTVPARYLLTVAPA